MSATMDADLIPASRTVYITDVDQPRNRVWRAVRLILRKPVEWIFPEYRGLALASARNAFFREMTELRVRDLEGANADLAEKVIVREAELVRIRPYAARAKKASARKRKAAAKARESAKVSPGRS